MINDIVMQDQPGRNRPIRQLLTLGNTIAGATEHVLSYLNLEDIRRFEMDVPRTETNNFIQTIKNVPLVHKANLNALPGSDALNDSQQEYLKSMLEAASTTTTPNPGTFIQQGLTQLPVDPSNRTAIKVQYKLMDYGPVSDELTPLNRFELTLKLTQLPQLIAKENALNHLFNDTSLKKDLFDTLLTESIPLDEPILEYFCWHNDEALLACKILILNYGNAHQITLDETDIARLFLRVVSQPAGAASEMDSEIDSDSDTDTESDPINQHYTSMIAALDLNDISLAAAVLLEGIDVNEFFIESEDPNQFVNFDLLSAAFHKSVSPDMVSLLEKITRESINGQEIYSPDTISQPLLIAMAFDEFESFKTLSETQPKSLNTRFNQFMPGISRFTAEEYALACGFDKDKWQYFTALQPPSEQSFTLTIGKISKMASLLKNILLSQNNMGQPHFFNRFPANASPTPAELVHLIDHLLQQCQQDQSSQQLLTSFDLLKTYYRYARTISQTEGFSFTREHTNELS